MKHRIYSPLIIVVVTLLYTFGQVPAVFAYGQEGMSADVFRSMAQPLEITGKGNGVLRATGTDTVLTVEPLRTYSIGERPIAVVHLTTLAGEPIPKQLIRVFSYKNRKAQGVTDSTGTAYIPLRWNLQVGTYDFTVVFIKGNTSKFAVSEAFGKLVIEPAQVMVQTVPPLEGIRFSFNDQTFVSDKDGRVRIKVNRIGHYRLEVLPMAEEANSVAHVEFSRWNKEVYVPYLDVRIPSKRPIEAGFLISYPVSYKFVDPAGQPVDPARISAMMLTAEGTTYEFKDAGPHWLPAYRLARRITSSLELLNVNYAIQKVIIDGSNVINQGQQRFQIHSPNAAWQIQLLLYSAHFSASDAMFHTPIGSGIQLEYPNGLTKEVRFGANSELEIPTLARGLYNAKVTGAVGSTPVTPLFLSRDQNVELLVISHWDFLIIFGIPVLMALLLLFIGRPHLLFSLQAFQSRRKTVGIIPTQPFIISSMDGVQMPTADIYSNMTNPLATEVEETPMMIEERQSSMTMTAAVVPSEDNVSIPVVERETFQDVKKDGNTSTGKSRHQKKFPKNTIHNGNA